MKTFKNFRDVSPSTSDVSAGFQFEFYCDACGETWRSPFRPYRKGQITGWLTRFAFMFSDLYKAGRATGAFSDAGANSAKSEALTDAQALAAQRYQHCAECHNAVCGDCWDDRGQQCVACSNRAKTPNTAGYGSGASSGASATACPNCQTASQGGRFCHECGFDMASTHKSCPGCGSTMPRQARFCTDCGHGF